MRSFDFFLHKKKSFISQTSWHISASGLSEQVRLKCCSPGPSVRQNSWWTEFIKDIFFNSALLWPDHHQYLIIQYYNNYLLNIEKNPSILCILNLVIWAS